MIAVTDSGSTKADWIFTDREGREVAIATRGLNPFLHTEEQIRSMLLADLGEGVDREAVEAVHFYGAGCSDEKRCACMAAGLQSVFPHASIYVEHDLLAAARATCRNEAGIACILGTGSNSCRFDGREITDNIPSLGYLPGDEGSGSHIGKELLRAYYYREMPPGLAEAFHREVAADKTAVWDQIYGPQPNVYLASLAAFAGRHLGDPYCRALAGRCFRDFLQRHVMKYENAREWPIHFVGSIAVHFREVLEEQMNELGLQPGRFLQKPIRDLALYYTLHHR